MTTNPMIGSESSLNTISDQPYDAAMSLSGSTDSAPYMKTNNKTRKSPRIKLNNLSIGENINNLRERAKEGYDNLTYEYGSKPYLKVKNYLKTNVLGSMRSDKYRTAKAQRKRNASVLASKIAKDTRECKKYFNKVQTDLKGLGNQLFSLPDTTRKIPFDPEDPDLEGDLMGVMFIKTEYEINKENLKNIANYDESKDFIVDEGIKEYAKQRGYKPPYYDKIEVNPLFEQLKLDEISNLLSGFDFGDDDSVDNSVPDNSIPDNSTVVANEESALVTGENQGYGGVDDGTTGYTPIAGGAVDPTELFFKDKVIPFIKKLHELTIVSDSSTEDNKYKSAYSIANELTKWNRMLALERYNNDDEDELVSESMPSLSSTPSINTSGGKKRKSKRNTRKKNKTKKRGKK